MAKSKFNSRSKGMKTVDCREGCGHTMEISEDSVAGTCWRCVMDMVAGRPVGVSGKIYSNKDSVEMADTVDMSQDEVDTIIDEFSE